MDDLSRRQFLGHSLGAVIASQVRMPRVSAHEPGLQDLMQYVDPLLRPPLTAISDAENGLLPLLEAVDSLTPAPFIDDDPEDLLGEKQSSEARGALESRWLDDNAAAIRLVEKAVLLGKLEYPNQSWSDARFYQMSGFRRLADLFDLRARRFVAEGKYNEAAHAGLTAAEAFWLCKNGRGVYVEYLIASACESRAWGTLRYIAQHEHASAETARAILASLPQRADANLSLKRTLSAEYCDFLLPLLAKTKDADVERIIQIFLDWDEKLEEFVSREEFETQSAKLAQMFAGHPRPYNLIDTVRRTSTHYTEMMRQLDLPWEKHNGFAAAPPSKELAAWPDKLPLSLGFLHGEKVGDVSDLEVEIARKSLRQVDNPIGKKLVDSCQLEGKSMVRAATSNRAQYDGTRLLVATCAFARDEKRLPERLEVLVDAKIIAELPIDPFSGKPFGYSRADGLIWSVGWDGKVGQQAAGEDDDEIDFEQHRWRLRLVDAASQ